MKQYPKEDIETLIVGFEKIDAMFLDKYPNLKILGSNTTGNDHISFDECEKRGIKVITLKGETEFLQTVSSTAEHTFGLIIALMRNYKSALHALHPDRSNFQGSKLAGKTLGIIGYGRIGHQVAKMAEGFGMKVLWVDKEFLSVDLDPLIRRSDIITCHIPLERNEGFFTLEMFRKMKGSAMFINTSRYGIIESGALLSALKNRYIAGAAVDFFDDEGLLAYSVGKDNVILTNHIGGYTFEDVGLTYEFIMKKIEDYESLHS